MKRRFLLINPPVLAVDRYQVNLYAESIPFGLIQIATFLQDQGHDVRLLDMMAYLDGHFESALQPENRWDDKPVGDCTVGATRAVFRYGRSLAWLAARLDTLETPDEIFVTCCISFNWQPAQAVLQLCRQRFPKAVLRLGGVYPTLFAEHAARLCADDVHQGRFREAEACFPDLALLEAVPPVWLFRLVLGCKYRCSFCINAMYRSEQVNDPTAVVAEILRIHRRFGVKTFSNWDPNVMLAPEVLEQFLDLMIAQGAPVELKFEMGIQPDRLTRPLAAKMKRAGVCAMTIPFESAEPAMMKRFGKPYRLADSMAALALCRELGFDTRRFHCTSVVGIRGESYHHIFGTYFGILQAGGQPTPFPLSLTPGTREYTTHQEVLAGKDLADLNGHLWPALSSLEEVERYDRMFAIINEPDWRKASLLAQDLPPEARAAFQHEFEQAANLARTKRKRAAAKPSRPETL